MTQEISTEEELERVKAECRKVIAKTMSYIESLAKKDSKYIFGDKVRL